MIAVTLFGAILALLLVVVVVSALLERPPPRAEGRGEAARVRQEAAIEALRELEFEFRTGKLEEEEYVRLRDAWAREALAARDELRRAREGGE